MKRIYECLAIIVTSIIVFIMGIAAGARLVFNGVIEVPPYCYEEMENNISQIEVILDSGEVLYFDKK